MRLLDFILRRDKAYDPVRPAHDKKLDLTQLSPQGYRFADNYLGLRPLVCVRCGAVVADFVTHDNWHKWWNKVSHFAQIAQPPG